MSIHTLNRLVAKVAGKTPLRTVLIVPFVLQLVGAVGLVGYLSYRNGQQAVEDLAYQLIDEVDERVDQNLQNYLDVPKQINQSLAAAIRTRVLNWKNFSGLEHYFAQQLQIYTTVSNVAIATEQQEFLAVEKSLASDSLVIRVLDKSTDYAFHYYAANRQGKRIKLTKVRQDYNPHQDPPKGRPWYQVAKEAGQAIWLPVVNLSQGVDHPMLTMVNFLPFDDPDGKFQGVLGASLFLPQFTSFLDSLKVGRTGQVFIIDRQGLLIASSTGETPFKQNLASDYLKNLNPQEWRVVARNSRNPLTQASVNFLLTHVNNFHQIEQKKKFDFDFHHHRHFLQVNPIQDKSKLDWLMITVVPEADFMTQIHANTRMTIMLCIVALIGSISVGILTARWITKPILRLNTAAKDIAKGEWDKTVEIERSDEVGELAQSFNQMAVHLQQSFAEFKSLNEALAQSESQLRQFLEAIPVGVSIHDATGKATYFNPTAKRLLDIDLIPDAASEELAAAYQLYRQNQLYPTEQLPALRALKGETVFIDDIEIHRDGKIIPFEGHATPIFDERGNITYAIVAFTDISDRKQSEKILAEYSHTLETQVAERTAELARTNDQLRFEIVERTLLEGKLYSSTQQVRAILESILDIVLIIDDKKSLQVIPTKTIGWYACDTNLLNSIVKQFFQEDTEEIWFAKVRQVLETQQSLNFDYSLRIDNREVWFTACISPLPDNSVVWVARDISDRQQVEVALRQQKKLRETIYNESTDALFLVDPKTLLITDCNRRSVELFEVNGQEDLIGIKGHTLQRQPFTPKELDQISTQMYQKGFWCREIEYVTRKGNIFWGNIAAKPVRIAGEVVHLVRVTDISDRIQAEQALQTSQARFAGILEIANDAIITVDASQRITLFNQGAEKIFGYTADQVLGQSLDLLLPAGARAIHRQHVTAFAKSFGKARRMGDRREIFGRRQDGTEFPAEASISKLEINGEKVFTTILRDISERKQFEKALIESEERFQEIARTISQFFFVRSASSGQFLYASPAYEKIWGRTCASLYQDPKSWLEAVHPDDRELLLGSLKEQFQGNSVRREYRIIQPDGSIRWIIAYISVVGDDAGQPLRFIGIAEDISDRKIAEEELRHSEQRYLAIIQDQTELIVRFWPDGTISFVNEAYCRYFGITRAQIIGHRYEPLIFEEDREYVDQLVKSITVENSVVTIENRMIVAGEVRWTQWINRALFDEQGSLIEVQAVGRDISDKKLAEASLRRYERIVSATTDAMSLVDRNYIYQVINHTYLTWHNKQYEEIVGHSVSEILGAEVFERVIKEPLDQCLAGETADYQNWFELALGQRFLSVNYSPYLEADHTISGVVISIRDITELKQIEERLRQRNQEMQAIFAAFPDILFRLAADGTVLEFKTKNYNNLYTSPETFLGKKVQDVLPADVGEKIHAAVRQALQTESPLILEYSLPLPDGEQYFEARIVRLHENEVIAVTRNISDRKLAELELQEREYRLRTLADNLPNGMIYQLVQEPNGKVYFSYITAGIERLVGIKPEVVMQDASVLHNLIIEEDRPLNEQLTEESLRNLSLFEMQMRKRTPTGEIQWSYVRSAPRRLDDGRTVWDGVEIDITNLKQAEAELAKAKEAAEAANRAKSTFLTYMSHELRTPLNGILGYAQILQADKNSTPQQQKGIRIIHQCGTHLLTLINDILDLSKIEAEKLELSPEAFNFTAFLTSLLEIFRLKAIQKSIHCTYLPIDPLPTTVRADEKRLRQVLMNLLSNAIKFTDAGSVTFKVEVIGNDQEVMGNQTRDSKEATNHKQQSTKTRFQVEDTGVGINPEQLAKIFLPFEQVGDSSRRSEGTGLGLAISQKIVAMMGSKIFVESTPGVGSRFWFDVELPFVFNPIQSPAVKAINSIIGYSGEKRKILIVDDCWENCSVFINILEPIGFELNEASNGQEGLEKAIEFQPDLIITDLVMPVMDGFEMTRQLRRLPQFQNTMIIATSASVSDLYQQESRESGCNDFLSKPVQAEELLNQIKDDLNLSWIYDQEESGFTVKLEAKESITVPLRQSPLEMVIPPREELLALYEAAISGDVEGVEQGIIQLQQLNPEYAPLVSRVMELAEDFEYEEIAKFVDGYLSQ